MENRETGNWEPETGQLAGFSFPVFGFLFFIFFLFGSGSAGLGNCRFAACDDPGGSEK